MLGCDHFQCLHEHLVEPAFSFLIQLFVTLEKCFLGCYLRKFGWHADRALWEEAGFTGEFVGFCLVGSHGFDLLQDFLSGVDLYSLSRD